MSDQRSSRLYLLTPPISPDDLDAFGAILRDALAAGGVACVLARLAATPETQGAAKTIVARLVEIATAGDAALLVDDDPRLAARAGADGAHIRGGAGALAEALESLKPERIVGAGHLRTRDEAMAAGEQGADYVMFGEPRADGFVPPAAQTIERVAWWAEIFEPPCVGFAADLGDIGPLVAAGADFVALADAIWSAREPAAALAQARAALFVPQAG